MTSPFAKMTKNPVYSFCLNYFSLSNRSRKRRQEVRARKPHGRGCAQGRLRLEPFPQGTHLPQDRPAFGLDSGDQ